MQCRPLPVDAVKTAHGLSEIAVVGVKVHAKPRTGDHQFASDHERELRLEENRCPTIRGSAFFMLI